MLSKITLLTSAVTAASYDYATNGADWGAVDTSPAEN
jgi:hypothetical protein|tara:strand:- start:1100 stop:1210 length:111 start_codon:yes stop_codon:yes gene_type:complete